MTLGTLSKVRRSVESNPFEGARVIRRVHFAVGATMVFRLKTSPCVGEASLPLKAFRNDLTLDLHDFPIFRHFAGRHGRTRSGDGIAVHRVAAGRPTAAGPPALDSWTVTETKGRTGGLGLFTALRMGRRETNWWFLRLHVSSECAALNMWFQRFHAGSGGDSQLQDVS